MVDSIAGSFISRIHGILVVMPILGIPAGSLHIGLEVCDASNCQITLNAAQRCHSLPLLGS
jgi:hypothetical protein